MKILGWLILIGFGIFVWSQSDPTSFQDTKDKLKESVIEKVLDTNITNKSMVVEQNFTNPVTGNYSANTINYGRPKKVIEFLCTTDADCKMYIPDVLQGVKCNKPTGECVYTK